MRHRDAVGMFAGARLGAPAPSVWADLGCGDGAFTIALADLLAPDSVVHAVDRDASSLSHVPSSFNGVRIDTHVADFTHVLPFAAPLDGILMANALHYVREKQSFIRSCIARLSPSGRFLIVEYDTDGGNPWVPYPVSARSLQALFVSVGFSDVQWLGSRRSVFQRARLYAALISRGPNL